MGNRYTAEQETPYMNQNGSSEFGEFSRERSLLVQPSERLELSPNGNRLNAIGSIERVSPTGGAVEHTPKYREIPKVDALPAVGDDLANVIALSREIDEQALTPQNIHRWIVDIQNRTKKTGIQVDFAADFLGKHGDQVTSQQWEHIAESGKKIGEFTTQLLDTLLKLKILEKISTTGNKGETRSRLKLGRLGGPLAKAMLVLGLVGAGTAAAQPALAEQNIAGSKEPNQASAGNENSLGALDLSFNLNELKATLDKALETYSMTFQFPQPPDRIDPTAKIYADWMEEIRNDIMIGVSPNLAKLLNAEWGMPSGQSNNEAAAPRNSGTTPIEGSGGSESLTPSSYKATQVDEITLTPAETQEYSAAAGKGSPDLEIARYTTTGFFYEGQTPDQQLTKFDHPFSSDSQLGKDMLHVGNAVVEPLTAIYKKAHNIVESDKIQIGSYHFTKDGVDANGNITGTILWTYHGETILGDANTADITDGSSWTVDNTGRVRSYFHDLRNGLGKDDIVGTRPVDQKFVGIWNKLGVIIVDGVAYDLGQLQSGEKVTGQFTKDGRCIAVALVGQDGIAGFIPIGYNVKTGELVDSVQGQDGQMIDVSGLSTPVPPMEVEDVVYHPGAPSNNAELSAAASTAAQSLETKLGPDFDKARTKTITDNSGNTISEIFTKYDADNSPRYEIGSDGKVTDLHVGRAEYEAFMGPSLMKMLTDSNKDLTWNQDLQGYQRKSDGAVFYPGLGTQKTGSNYDQDDLKEGFTKQTVDMQTSDYKPGQSGTRFSIMLSEAHPAYQDIKLFDGMNNPQAIDAFLKVFLQHYKSIAGQHVILEISGEDITSLANQQTKSRQGVLDGQIADNFAGSFTKVKDANTLHLRASVAYINPYHPDKIPGNWFSTNVFSSLHSLIAQSEGADKDQVNGDLNGDRQFATEIQDSVDAFDTQEQIPGKGNIVVVYFIPVNKK